MLATFEQSSDCGPVFVFGGAIGRVGILMYSCSCARVQFEQNKNIINRRISAARIECYSSVATAAAAAPAAAESARVVVTASLQDMRKRCIHHVSYLVDCF